MHGLGNDFVIIDARLHAVVISAANAAAISDRQSGIGWAPLFVLPASAPADVRM